MLLLNCTHIHTHTHTHTHSLSLSLSLSLSPPVAADPLSKVQLSAWLLQLGGGAVFLRTVGRPLLPDTQVKDR